MTAKTPRARSCSTPNSSYGLDEEDALARGFSLHEVQPPQAASDAGLRGRMVQSLGGRA